jgi:WD40 repeat protein
LAFYLFGICCFAHAADNKRVALIIANSQYQHTAALKNPANDAKLVAGQLHELGFEVQVEKDMDAKGFARDIQDFASKLDKNTEALFYYAGHGWQYQGENYLVGVDAKLESEATIPFETFRLNTVINLLESKASTTLIFWDGCRNNPLANGLQIGKLALITESSPAVRGSAPIPPSRSDVLVVFSAEPNNFAVDGSDDFSPFAEALAKHIATPNLEIEAMLKRVTADVLAKTNNRQQPQVLSQLAQEFYFKQQENDERAYKQELEALRAKIAQLEHPASEKHFAIVGSELPAKQGSPITQMPAAASSVTAPPVPDASATQPVPVIEPNIAKPDVVRPPVAPLVTAPPAARAGASATATQLAPIIEPDVAKPDVLVSVNLGQSTIIRKLRVAPNGKLLAIGGDDGIIRIVSLDTFEVVQTINAHAGRISDLDFAPDSQTLLSAGRDGFLRFWDAKTGQRMREDLRVDASVPYTARLNPQFPNRFVLMGDKEGRLFAWDLARNGRLVANGKFHNAPVLAVAYQPGGKGTYLSAGGDGLLKVRLPEGQRYTVHAHTGAIFDAGYNPSGTLIYTAGSDRKIKIWDANKLGPEVSESVLEGHLKYVLAAAVSPNGRMMASGGGDKAIDLWDVSSQKLIGRLVGHTSDIEALAFTPNSQFVISSSEDRTVGIWSVDGQKELVRMFFRSNNEKYAGVTYDNNSFGDREAGLMTVFVDGRAVDEKNALNYIGHGISVVDVGRSPR